MERGKIKSSLVILLTSVIGLLIVRSYFRFSNSGNFRKYEVFNDYIYYYIIFILPALLFLAFKKGNAKYISIVSWFLSFINLILLSVYIHLNV